MKNKKEYRYHCQNCGKGTNIVYSDITKKKGICEKCWEDEVGLENIEE